MAHTFGIDADSDIDYLAGAEAPAETWCSRCEKPSVADVGNEFACGEHAVAMAAERLLVMADHGGEDLRPALEELRSALRAAQPLVVNPTPEVERDMAARGGLAY